MNIVLKSLTNGFRGFVDFVCYSGEEKRGKGGEEEEGDFTFFNCNKIPHEVY